MESAGSPVYLVNLVNFMEAVKSSKFKVQKSSSLATLGMTTKTHRQEPS
jgi:hypothetical protein